MAEIMFLKTATNRNNFEDKWPRWIRSRRGSYIVEAAITLPLFIIAVVVLSSIILMYAAIENCTFMAANELRIGAAEAVFADPGILIPHRLKTRILDNCSQVGSARVTDFGYRVSRWGQDELIAVSMNLRMRTDNPLGLKAHADYELSLVTRAYVGKIRDVQPMSADEMAGKDARAVYIFPKRGERYHSKGCGFLTAASTTGVLTSGMKKKYKPCPICGSRKAGIGTRIYYFPDYGESYHLGGCPALERNYIEIDLRDAVARGYTPCSKCGG